MRYAQYIKRMVLVVGIFLVAGSFRADYAETVNIKVQFDNHDVIISVRARNKNVDFYMFTVNGCLVRQRNIQGSEKFCITHLSKGIYLYDLFNKDERLKSGKIEIK